MDKQYDVSVIIPVYNVVEYLEETIDSVVRQTIGFENIELILVNDGSTDGSESICLKYKEMFPDNVVYVKQKNAGVSVARNNGLKHAHGRYINFLDSDDKWDEKAFEKGVKLLEENLDMMVAIYPICFFDASVGKHPLNYVNEENKVIDIRKNYDSIQLSSCSCLFRASALEGRQYFDKLKISEDARLITEIFLDYPVNYAISGVYYRYRKRTDQSSTIQTSQKSKSWYLDTPKYCYQYLIDLSKEKYNEVIKYVQFLIIYDLHWRLNVSPDETLTKEETKEYYNLIKEIMDNLDDKLIASFPMMNVQEKLYFLNYKYHSCSIYQLKDHNLCIGKNIICSEEYMPITINNIYTEKDMAFIYGRMPLINGVLSDVYLLDESDHKIPFEHYELDKGTKTLLHLKNDVNCPMVGIKAVVDLSKHHTFALYGTNGTQTYRVNFTMSYTCQLSNCFYGLYLRSEHYYLKHDSKKIMISKKSALQKVKLETACLFKMLCQRRFKSFVYRVCALGYHLFHRKPIWIVSDRINAGEDNGQAFFEYLNTIKPKNIKYYFAIDKKCHDGQKLSAKYKNVIQHASFKHRILHLNASKIISAQADNYVTNLFGKGKNYVGDLYRFQFVFLQHGIIKDDLSPWLNINNRVINMFVTSAIPEYESIAGTEYCYNFPPEWIKLTGLARYDK